MVWLLHHLSVLVSDHTKEGCNTSEGFCTSEYRWSQNSYSHPEVMCLYTHTHTHTQTADVCWRMLTYADVCWRMMTYTDICSRMLTYVHVAHVYMLQCSSCSHDYWNFYFGRYINSESVDVCQRRLTYADVCRLRCSSYPHVHWAFFEDSVGGWS